MPDVAALRERLTALNQNANWVLSEAVTHFAFALSDDENLPYLDVTVGREGRLPHAIDFGQLVALTNAGVLVELSYRGDKVGPVRLRPLRGRVREIESSYDAVKSEGGRIQAGAVSIALDGEDCKISLPLTPRKDGAAFLAPIVAALVGA